MLRRDIRPSLAGTEELIDSLAGEGYPLHDDADLDPLLERIGEARYVLLGEASHGTSDYYTWRARISRRLIEEKGFSFLAVEGDWPDCYAINRYVKGYDDAGETMRAVLQAFERWPTWMWANWEIAALGEWLRRYNTEQAEQAPASRVGFYGLDVYSLWESLTELMGYLEENVPEALDAAHRAWLCFEPYGEDVQEYARSTALVPEGCEREVVALLGEVRRQVRSFPGDPEADFNAEQNAYVTAEAERYYRAMIGGGAASWNVRDYHMADTLQRLMAHHEQKWGDGQSPKAIIWEHNTHIGDARYTDMARAGMVNVGQIARERYGDDAVLVGFGSYEGSVIAGDAWGAPMAQMRVPSAQAGSWEQVLHAAGGDRLLLMDELQQLEAANEWRGHRAIGVVYHPGYEFGNYVPTQLPQRYDAFLFLDRSEALHPLHVGAEEAEAPATYPWGF